MSSPDTGAIQQLTTQRRLNWKRGGIALLLAILVVGLGHLYDRRWRLAIAYELLFPALLLLGHAAILHNTFAGITVFIAGGLLQVFAIGQAVWFGLHRPKRTPMPPLGKVIWVLAITIAALTTVGWGSGFFQGQLAGLKGYKINSDSMAPTMRLGDRVFVDVKAYTHSPPRRGDIIAFAKDPKVIFAKRVIGIAGDTLSFRPTGIILNGTLLKEPYLAPPDPSANPQRIFPEHTVSSGDVFVLGDNRDDSYDSRYFGDVSDKAVIGRVIGIYWSRDRSRIGTAVR